jgi:poly(hydroxyalkanoate) granule-associated protein
MAQFAVNATSKDGSMSTESKTDDPADAGWPLWQPPPGLPEPARQVWLAGLGAFSRAQAEGGKAFEALVHQGLALQTQASQVAREHFAEAAQAAVQPWERLSSLFEDRVARALVNLGLPAAQDWAALQARVQALEIAWQNAVKGAVKDGSRAAPKAVPAKSATQQPLAPGKIKPRAASGKKTRTPSP